MLGHTCSRSMSYAMYVTATTNTLYTTRYRIRTCLHAHAIMCDTCYTTCYIELSYKLQRHRLRRWRTYKTRIYISYTTATPQLHCSSKADFNDDKSCSVTPQIDRSCACINNLIVSSIKQLFYIYNMKNTIIKLVVVSDFPSSSSSSSSSSFLNKQ